MNQAGSPQNTIVHAKDVTKAYTRPVLKNVSLVISQPQSVLLCGINGAGKSTLLKILSGLLQPDAGSVTISGKSLRHQSEQVRSKLGIIMHQSLVYSDLTVLENLDFFARLYGVRSPQQHIAALLEQMGLTAFRFDKAAALSRGLLQRLSIARALIHEPEVIFADEPFTGLDMTSAQYLRSMLSDFREHGGTILLTTHDVAQGLRCAERVIVMDQGRFIFDRSVEQVDRVRFAEDYLLYAKESA